MLQSYITLFQGQLSTILMLIAIINGLIHLIFAGAVAKDAGRFNTLGQKTALVSAPVWAFATLIGGVMVAGLYWFIHHSNLTRPEK